jgi:ferrochelatase
MRYKAIGGVSPLMEHSNAQVEGIGQVLEQWHPGCFVVQFGAKHTSPFIEDGIDALKHQSVDSIVGVVLTPHNAGVGTGDYVERAERRSQGVPFVGISSWYEREGMADLWAKRLRATMEESAARSPKIFFTAHSVPERTLGSDRLYELQRLSHATSVARLAGIKRASWDIAWQSKGATSDPWLGPTLLDAISEVDSAAYDAVIVCPLGFVSDHLEILYDLDIQAKERAEDHGISFWRTASFNADPAFLTILGHLIAEKAHDHETNVA